MQELDLPEGLIVSAPRPRLLKMGLWQGGRACLAGLLAIYCQGVSIFLHHSYIVNFLLKNELLTITQRLKSRK